MLAFEFWYTLSLLVLLSIVLISEIIETDIAIFSTLLLLVLGGVIDLSEALIGFSNQGMLTVGLLFVVAAAVQRTGIFNLISGKLMGKGGSTSVILLRFLPPIAAISAFFNNTPIVLMFIPSINSWARKNHRAVSKFLIPLSYASILGGICTLIGTSTTLVVHGLMLDKGMKGLSFFEISKAGIPVAIAGLIIIITVGHRLLPERKDPITRLGTQTREFVVVMKTGTDYPHNGKSVEAAGLRHLRGLFLFQIERNQHLINPVTPEEILRSGDRLFFTGLPETIMELQRQPGLYILKDKTFDLKHFDSDKMEACEAVISTNSPLIGQNIRESNFRSTYNAVIIAIHRSGERINNKIGDIVIRPGDTLLILSGHGFVDRWYHSRDFYLVSKSTNPPTKPVKYSYISGGVLIGMISLIVFNLMPVLLAVGLATIILILSGSISPHDARNSIDWKVLLVIASAFGIARAMENSGLAAYMASHLIALSHSTGALGMLATVYFMTSFYTETITNNAAAALVFPIAYSMAVQAGMDPMPFLIAVAIGASASFATPIGYQTNLIVYGPGGYRFKDFLKIGIPMNLSIGILAIPIIYFFYC
jgi:di/tricarboxylate transporter